MSLVILSWYSL